MNLHPKQNEKKYAIGTGATPFNYFIALHGESLYADCTTGTAVVCWLVHTLNDIFCNAEIHDPTLEKIIENEAHEYF